MRGSTPTRSTGGRFGCATSVQDAEPEAVRYYLGDRVVLFGDDDPPPTTGLLIISPVYEAGPYGPPDAYAALQPFEPDAVIGHGLLVYDLDRLGGGAPFCWSEAAGSLGRQAGLMPDARH